MRITLNRLAWLKSGLFWRTFVLLSFLITVSMAAWVLSFRMLERGPRAQQMAAQVVSIVTITRAALTHSAPEMRRELLFDLASDEGVRVYPLEQTDQVEPVPDEILMPELQTDVRAKLGGDTKFAGKVNDVSGFWISFKIGDDDEYWLMLERDRLERAAPAGRPRIRSRHRPRRRSRRGIGTLPGAGTDARRLAGGLAAAAHRASPARNRLSRQQPSHGFVG